MERDTQIDTRKYRAKHLCFALVAGLLIGAAGSLLVVGRYQYESYGPYQMAQRKIDLWTGQVWNLSYDGRWLPQ